MKIIFNIFIILHGLVHLFYFAQSNRNFELRPNMTWPDNSWLLSKFVGVKIIRIIASIACIIAAIGFVVSGIGSFFNEAWLKITIYSAFSSSFLYIIFWDRSFKKLDDQGGIGILINIGLLILIMCVF